MARKEICNLCCRLYIYTRTDQADSRRGFRIKYYTGCNIIINRPNGTIHSPAYGVASYPANQVGSRGIYWHIVKQTEKNHKTIKPMLEHCILCCTLHSEILRNSIKYLIFLHVM